MRAPLKINTVFQAADLMRAGSTFMSALGQRAAAQAITCIELQTLLD